MLESVPNTAATAPGKSAFITRGCLKGLGTLTLCLLVLMDAAHGSTTTIYTGNLIGNGDPAVVGRDLGAASTDPDDGSNVALYHFTMSATGTLGFSSTGYLTGGIDPWVSIFSGSDFSAIFAGSNGDHAQTIGGDFDLNLLLSAGDYILAISAYQNMSFAENLGIGSLADGFTGIVDSFGLGNGAYSVTLTQDADNGSVPEPSTASLALAGLLLAGLTAAARGKGSRTPLRPASVPSAFTAPGVPGLAIVKSGRKSGHEHQ